MARSRGSITWQLANLQRMLQVQQVRRHLASSSSSSSCCQFVGFLPGWNCIAHSFIHSPVESLVGLFIHSSGSLAEREREREREREIGIRIFSKLMDFLQGLWLGPLMRCSWEFGKDSYRILWSWFRIDWDSHVISSFSLRFLLL